MTTRRLMNEEQILPLRAEALSALEQRDEPAWLVALRRQAIESFSALDIPTTRMEDWHYTNVSAIAKAHFSRGISAPAPTRADIAHLEIPDHGGDRFVFIDGRYDETLSERRGAPGVAFQSLAALIQDTPEPEANGPLAHFADLASFKDDAFTALRIFQSYSAMRIR